MAKGVSNPILTKRLETASSSDPGPTSRPAKTGPVPGFRISLFDSFDELVEKLGDAFQASGDVVQIKGLPVRIYAFRNPEHIRTILTDRTVGERKQPALLPRVRHVMGQGAYIMKGGPVWKEKRKRIQPLFTEAAGLRYLPKVEKLTEEWIETLCTQRDQRAPLDILKEMKLLILQISSSIFFSNDLRHEVAELLPTVEYIETHFLSRLPLWLPLPSHLRFRRETARLRARMESLVEARLAQTQTQQDVLNELLPFAQAYGKSAIVDEMLSIFLGASVMGTTLTWGLYRLSQDQQTWGQLRNQTPNGSANAAEIAKGPLVQRVVKEVLRLYPASWGYPRFCESEQELGGYRIPPRSILIPAVYHLHRDPGIWHHPDSFDPSRFELESIRTRPAFSHLPFGAGVRNCLGARVAPLIIQLILSKLASRFELTFRRDLSGTPEIEFGFEIAPRRRIWMDMRARS